MVVIVAAFAAVGDVLYLLLLLLLLLLIVVIAVIAVVCCYCGYICWCYGCYCFLEKYRFIKGKRISEVIKIYKIKPLLKYGRLKASTIHRWNISYIKPLTTISYL